MSITGSSTAAACQQCGDGSRCFMHHVRHMGTIKTLCTGCVLHLHARSLCPICFEVHENPDTLTSDVVVSCVRCFSSSHITCVGYYPNPPYLCTRCVHQNSPLLVLRDSNGGIKMDQKGSRVLLAACKISADSMKKAAVAAKKDALVKVKEAINARKKATKAVEHLNGLIEKQNQ